MTLSLSILERCSEHDSSEDAAELEPPPALQLGAHAATQQVLSALYEAFQEPFTLVDVATGHTMQAGAEGLQCDLFGRIELLAEVYRRGKPEIVEEVAPLSLLAIPLGAIEHCGQLVAVCLFVNQQVETKQEIAAASRALGVDSGRALRWTQSREVWPPRAVVQLATKVLETFLQRQQVEGLRSEVRDAISHARDTYAELGLLHRLTGHLHLSESESQLWQSALEWLSDSVPAQCLAVVSNGSAEDDTPRLLPQELANVLFHGECPVDSAELPKLMQLLGASAEKKPLVLNRAETALPTWTQPTVREFASVPIRVGDQLLGWLLALNHRGSATAAIDSFGSVEVRLLSSVGTILGIHSSNLASYQERAELFADSVQALTSAIDAKDPYTSGHSDRVARLSVSLAEQMGLDKETRDTLYLGGLLHDIGKIGIDDQVLNKRSKLTQEEYEHIKLHPQLGYDILKSVRKLEKVLPCVLHHHEAWDGGGYPSGLKGAETPLVARIMAVADAFDAMTSDRPYRQGMPAEKLEAILREGAGSQWDPEVVAAFFELRDQSREEEPSGQVEPTLAETNTVN